MDNLTWLIIIVISILAARYILYEYKKLKDRKPPEEKKKKKKSLPKSHICGWGKHIIDDHIKEYRHYLKDPRKGRRRHL